MDLDLDDATFLAPPPLGDDRGDGSRKLPVATLGRALALGRRTIALAGGGYPGAFALGGEVALRGGLEPAADWRRTGPPSVLTGGNQNRAVTVLAGARVRFDGLTVAPIGAACMGVLVDAGGHATFTACVLAGGTGPGGRPSALSSWGEVHVLGCRLDGGPGEQTTAISAFGRATIVDCDLEASHIGVNCSGATVERNRIRAGTYGVYVRVRGQRRAARGRGQPHRRSARSRGARALGPPAGAVVDL